MLKNFKMTKIRILEDCYLILKHVLLNINKLSGFIL